MKTEAQWDEEWEQKYGKEAARTIRRTVDASMVDYEYLRQFVLQPKGEVGA